MLPQPQPACLLLPGHDRPRPSPVGSDAQPLTGILVLCASDGLPLTPRGTRHCDCNEKGDSELVHVCCTEQPNFGLLGAVWLGAVWLGAVWLGAVWLGALCES